MTSTEIRIRSNAPAGNHPVAGMNAGLVLAALTVGQGREILVVSAMVDLVEVRGSWAWNAESSWHVEGVATLFGKPDLVRSRDV